MRELGKDTASPLARTLRLNRRRRRRQELERIDRAQKLLRSRGTGPKAG